MANFTLLIFSALALVSSCAAHYAPVQPCPSKVEIDNVLSRLYTFGPLSGRKFPVTFSGLIKYCEDTKNLLAQVDAYADNCLYTKLQQKTARIYLAAVRKEVQQACIFSPTGRPTWIQNALIDTGKCANAAQDDVQTCLDQSLGYVADIKYIHKTSKKFGQLCCNVNKINSCILDGMLKPLPYYKSYSPKPTAKCVSQQANIAVDFLKNIYDTVWDPLCKGLNADSYACAPFIVDRPFSTHLKYKSVLLTLLDGLGDIQPDQGYGKPLYSYRDNSSLPINA